MKPEERILELIGKISDKSMRKICEEIVATQEFRTSPAAAEFHHAYTRGLMMHTIEVIEIGMDAIKHVSHDDHDIDVFITAAIFHDAGKILEYKIEEGMIKTTDAAALVGHIAISLGMFMSAAKKELIPNKTQYLVGHAIVAHHGFVKEWGSPIPPKTMPAMVLHHSDMLSAFHGASK